VGYTSLSPEELIRKCAETPDNALWEEFISRFHALISSIVYRVVRGVSPVEAHEVDDLVQDIYLKFCADDRRLLRRFTARDSKSTFAFIKVVAANAARDYLRSRLAIRRWSPATTPAEQIDPPAPDADVERQVLLAEVGRILDTVAPGEKHAADRAVFWLYFRQGLTARAISELPSVSLSESGVESIIHRLVVAVRTEMGRGRRKSDGNRAANSFLE
jgi:RNA polymerase sigma-70 factor (ECF subfamily)